DERAPEALEKRAGESGRHEITHERCSDDDGPRADHPHGNRDEELTFVQPARLLHEALFQERDDDETAAEREGTGLQEEGQQLSEQRTEAALGNRGDHRYPYHHLRRRHHLTPP